MAEFTRVRECIEETVGRGESADGRISAEYRAKGGLTALDLDPRALRMPSPELSEQIRIAVNAASADFQAKVREAAGELYPSPEDGGEAMDPAAALRQLDKISDGFASQMKELARELGIQQRRAQEAMAGLGDSRVPGARVPGQPASRPDASGRGASGLGASGAYSPGDPFGR
jgi:hypothetical protein